MRTHPLISPLQARVVQIMSLTCLVVIVMAQPAAAAAECLIRQTAGQPVTEFTLVHPGADLEWTIGIENITNDSISTSLSFMGSGTLAEHIRLDVDVCPDPWEETIRGSNRFVCRASPVTVMNHGSALKSEVDTSSLQPGESLHVRVTATLPASSLLPDHVQDSSGTVTSQILANGLSGTQACAPTPQPRDTPPHDTATHDTAPHDIPPDNTPPRDPSTRDLTPTSGSDRLPRTGNTVFLHLAIGLGLITAGVAIRQRQLHTVSL